MTVRRGETVGQLGEFPLIRRIRRFIASPAGAPEAVDSARGVILGAGDDAAVVRPVAGWDLVVTCDIQVAGRHFLPRWMDPLTVGRRAMVINLSDIAAMGAEPRHALISLGLPPEMAADDVEGLYNGFADALSGTGASIIGGNLTATGPEWFCDITLMGRVEQGMALTRSGARPGDRILVTGCPGRSAAGLALLARLESEVPEWRKPGAPEPRGATSLLFDPDTLDRRRQLLEGFFQAEPWGRSLVEAYVAPSARIAAGRALVRTGQPRPVSALIDLSDGLYGDLMHICEESRVRARLEAGRLPITPDLEQAARHFGLEPQAWSLQPSDDYELLFTARPEAAAGIAERLRADCALTVTDIGEILETVDAPEKAAIEITGLPKGAAAGWDHFRAAGKA